MNDYIRYLLFTLIFIWLIGFFYMLESGQSSGSVVSRRNSNSFDIKMKSRLNNDHDDDGAGIVSGYGNEIDLVWEGSGGDSKSQLKMLNRIRRIEKELQQLDLRNKENDFIIKNLK